ncbi:MAG: hypothetical protein LBQ88_07770 [Treponema sp.]|nr:hypothetical protein [Treponema sp.]
MDTLETNSTGRYIEPYIRIEPGKSYTMQIIPDPAVQLEPFDLTMKAHWIQSKISQCTVGFSVEQSVGNSLEAYSTYLKQHGQRV